MGEMVLTYRLSNSGFGSEALFLTGHLILASFALELAVLAWITQGPSVLAGCHLYAFLTDTFLSALAHCMAWL